TVIRPAGIQNRLPIGGTLTVPAIQPILLIVEWGKLIAVPIPENFIALYPHHLDAKIKLTKDQTYIGTINKVGGWITDQCAVVWVDFTVVIQVLATDIAG